MGGSGAADRLEQGQRMGGAFILLEQHFVGKFERGQTADAGADDAGRAVALVVFARELELRLGDSFLRRAAGILRIFVGEHERLCLQPLLRIEIGNLTGDGDVEVLGGEALDLANTALAVLERRPKTLYASAQRSHYALASDHDAAAAIRMCHTS